MIPRIVKTIFLALGLAMVWLGFLYHYELTRQEEQQEVAAGEGHDAAPSGQLETYTLSNDAYSDEAIEELEFKKLDNKERTLIYPLGDFPESEKGLESVNTAGFAEEFDLMEMEEEIEPEATAVERFPLLLSGGGVVFLIIGFFSLRLEQ